jgi:ribA/ribD-fused uncharacterized protein
MSESLENVRSIEQLRALMDAGTRPELLLFWGHRAKDHQIGAACLSQRFPAPFTLEGVRYPTAEHYMMAEKARLFGDRGREEKILAAPDPAAAKRIGRQVRGFEPDAWEAQRGSIVVSANLAKFGQNEKLRGFLLWTAPRVLVEASPVDAIWGIGLARDDPRAAQPAEWPGLNLLGFALMEVRARLVGEGR